MEYTVGCDGDGRLTAVRARLLGDTGAYASVGGKVLERAAGHACGPYKVPNVDVEATAVCTNNPPCGAMRGFGANQAHFAMEGCMDLLAEKTGLDGWEIRWRNALEVGDPFTSGQILEKSVGLKKTLEAVKPDYYRALQQGRAVGVACGIKNSGIGNGAQEWGKSRLVVEDNGTVSLYNGYTEMGQGLLTVLIQCAVEVTGLPASTFQPKVDSTYALACGQTTGSRATLLGGRAVAAAARKLRADLDQGRSLDELAGRVYAGEILVDDTTAPGQPAAKIKTHTAFGYATQVCILDQDGRVERFFAAHDVGRAVNPALCEGQIEGSIHMGLGYALTEELQCENGMPVTFKLRELGPLRAHHMPEIKVVLVEEPEPEGPFGAKGVGEIGLVPTAPAVAAALAAFDGQRRYRLPMIDSPAARALNVGRSARVCDGRINSFPHGDADEGALVLDCGDSRLEPGRVNAHTHIYSGLAPLGMPPPSQAPEDFVQILERIWWRLDRALDEATLRASARLYVAEALLAGTTTLIDHHESPDFIEGSLDVLADACHELGVRAVLCYGATERNGGREEARRGLAECRRFFQTNDRPLVRGVVGLHASFTVSDQTIREAAGLCSELGTVLHVHLAEDLADVHDARNRGYPGPLERLDTLGALPPGSLLAHGVHLQEDQVRRAADLGCWIVQNPRSNRGNRVGYPGALASSSRVALGTDGYPADMVGEAQVLLEEAGRHGDETTAAAERPRAGWTLLDEHFGSTFSPLAAGGAPDLGAFDAGKPRHLVVGGRLVVRDGNLLSGDLKAIRAEAQLQAPRLWERMVGL
jgi:cytosine/adenosine deaminase-related metal-dependent hydrolase